MERQQIHHRAVLSGEGRQRIRLVRRQLAECRGKLDEICGRLGARDVVEVEGRKRTVA